MNPSAAFQLESLSYQTDAVESVVRVFEGSPKPAAADLAGNRCPLTWAQISANLEAIALRHRVVREQDQPFPYSGRHKSQRAIVFGIRCTHRHAVAIPFLFVRAMAGVNTPIQIEPYSMNAELRQVL